jgi:hypothetical protein
MMPILLGIDQMVFVISEPQWISLIVHIVFGVVTGQLFVPLNKHLH